MKIRCEQIYFILYLASTAFTDFWGVGLEIELSGFAPDWRRGPSKFPGLINLICAGYTNIRNTTVAWLCFLQFQNCSLANFFLGSFLRGQFKSKKVSNDLDFPFDKNFSRFHTTSASLFFYRSLYRGQLKDSATFWILGVVECFCVISCFFECWVS